MQGVKLMRDRVTGRPSGFGFAEFSSHDVAARVLATLNGRPFGEPALALSLALCAHFAERA
jgi:RNA recognition motif-containing protein